MPNLANLDYVDRVNRSIDHITRSLDEPLRLEDVAHVAGFSPYHFHRIFQGLVGETLRDFVNRLRLERAVYLMAHAKGRSWTDVALAVGFSSSSAFSRSFREHFGVSPRAFDVQSFRRGRFSSLVDTLPDPVRLSRLPDAPADDRFAVGLRDLPERRVAYIRVFRPYGGTGVRDALTRLMAWAEERDFDDGQWLGYQWDDPTIVPLDQCRYDVGLEIPPDAAVDGDVSETVFAPMRVAEIEIAGPIELELEALDWVYSTWLPRSGYVPDHQPGFEAWNGRPFAHGETHFEFRIQVPVVPATRPP